MKKKILLIQPKNNLTDHFIELIENFKIPPLALLRIATITPKDYEIEIIDENVERLIFRKVDLVGISIHGHVVAKRAYKIADEFRKRDVKVIIGGLHATFFPDECLKHADSVVVGEVDNEWSNILSDFDKKKLNIRYICKKPDITNIPALNPKFITNKKYDFYNLIQTTRGCPFGCEFCLPCAYYGKKVRHRNIEEVIHEISIFKNNCGKSKFNKFFIFTDDNIISDINYSMDLFRKLIPLKVRWGAQCSINIAYNNDLLDLAYKSGCRALFIGFESITQESLNESNKKFKVYDYPKLIKKIKEKGIYIYASFVFGFDHDYASLFGETLQFCYKNNIDFANFHILTPYIGTELYKKLKKEGRLLVKTPIEIDREGVYFEPKNMTKKQLIDGVIKNYKMFYSVQSIIKRILKVNKIKYILPLLLVNSSFRKKILKMQNVYKKI